MATYKSEGLYRANRARAVYDGKLHTRSETILVPAGTTIATNDTMRFFRVAPISIVPTRVIVDASGALDQNSTAASRTLVGKLGYLKSSDRSGNNLSFLTSVPTTVATESDTFLLAGATAPIVNSPTVAFSAAGTNTSNLGTLAGAVGIYNPVAASQDSRGYDANVMDVAITFSAGASQATTSDVYITITLEYMGVPTAPSGQVPFLYRNRYSSTGVSTL